MAKPGQFSYAYPRPALTVDAVVWTLLGRQPHLLLIQRKHEPFAGRWALPGGFVDEGERLSIATRRELAEETNLKVGRLWSVGTYGDPGRDPRGWTVSAVTYGVLPGHQAKATAGDDASETRWFPFQKLPRCAFDHSKILRDAWQRVCQDMYSLPVLAPLLPKSFTQNELFVVYSVFDPSLQRAKVLRRLRDAGVIEGVPQDTTRSRFVKIGPRRA